LKDEAHGWVFLLLPVAVANGGLLEHAFANQEAREYGFSSCSGRRKLARAIFLLPNLSQSVLEELRLDVTVMIILQMENL